MKTKVEELMDIAWTFAHAVSRHGTCDVDNEEDEMQKAFEAALKFPCLTAAEIDALFPSGCRSIGDALVVEMAVREKFGATE